MNNHPRRHCATSSPPASIIERISEVSMAVTARAARTSVPKGSPTRCATTSAWWTAAMTAPIDRHRTAQHSTASKVLTPVKARNDEQCQ